jgi:hypothetical protein
VGAAVFLALAYLGAAFGRRRRTSEAIAWAGLIGGAATGSSAIGSTVTGRW